MGTRGILGSIINGKRVGSYNHFDSYPEGLGKEIMKFLMGLTAEDKAKFKANIEKITWVNADDPVPDHLRRRYSHLIEPDQYMIMYMEHIDPETVGWADLLRPTQTGKSLPLILEGKLEHLLDETEFANDRVFCEYIYWIDIDREVLEIEGLAKDTVVIPFADFKEGLLGDLRAYGVKYDGDE